MIVVVGSIFYLEILGIFFSYLRMTVCRIGSKHIKERHLLNRVTKTNSDWSVQSVGQQMIRISSVVRPNELVNRLVSYKPDFPTSSSIFIYSLWTKNDILEDLSAYVFLFHTPSVLLQQSHPIVADYGSDWTVAMQLWINKWVGSFEGLQTMMGLPATQLLVRTIVLFIIVCWLKIHSNIL